MQSFKAYLTVEGSEEKEIRKFALESKLAKDFYCLKEVLQCLFPIRDKRFTITWKDVEGDNIMLSNDAELAIALQESSGNANKKLYILLHSDNDKKFHPHVICDVCDKEIRGFRYKCIECPDYDLCSKCEAYGQHAQHCMLRLPTQSHWTSRHGKQSLVHNMKKFIKMYSKYGHASREEHPKRDCSRKEHTRECPIMKGVRLDLPKMNMKSSSDCEEECSMENNLKPPEPATEATASSTKSQSQETKKEAKPYSDMLKIVEDNIVQLLHPFGIDIIMKVKDNEKPNDIPTKQTDFKEPSTSNTNPFAKPSAKFPGRGRKLIEKENENNLESNIESSNNTDSSSEKSCKSDDDDDQWTILNKEEKSSPAVTAHAAVQAWPDPATSAGHTNMECANLPEVKNTSSSPGQEQRDPSLYPSLPSAPTMEPTVYHQDPNIQVAVESMMSMGFHNENNWLTHLLVTANGDVAKVLDILLEGQQ